MSHPSSTHLRAVQELQDRYRCHQCSSNGYCFIKEDPDTGKQEHINLDQKILNLWAAEMIVMPARATILYPPMQVKEIAKLMNPKAKKTNNNRVVASNEATTSLAPPISVVCNFPNPSERSACLLTPVICRRHEKSVSSPVFNVDPADYKDKGLMEFLTWCGKKYKDPEGFEVDVYEKLRDQDVGLDIFKDNGGIDAETLKRECNLTFGTAKRLVGSYNDWELSRKKVRNTYNGILHVLN
jgi:hypothetical protein